MATHLSARQAADHCGVSEKTVRNWIATGKLSAEKVDGTFQIAVEALDAVVRGHLHGSAAAEPMAAKSAESFRGRSATSTGTTADRPADTPADGVIALIEALRLIDKLQDANQQLAGQVGFLQAQLEQAREQLRLLAPPPTPVAPTPVAPTPAADAADVRADVPADGADSAETALAPVTGPERPEPPTQLDGTGRPDRPWWRRLWPAFGL
jgi:hypothetical protein